MSRIKLIDYFSDSRVTCRLKVQGSGCAIFKVMFMKREHDNVLVPLRMRQF